MHKMRVRQSDESKMRSIELSSIYLDTSKENVDEWNEEFVNEKRQAVRRNIYDSHRSHT